MSRTMAPTKPSRPPKSSSCTTCSTLRGRPVHGACHACCRARRPITAAASGVMAAQPRRAQDEAIDGQVRRDAVARHGVAAHAAGRTPTTLQHQGGGVPRRRSRRLDGPAREPVGVTQPRNDTLEALAQPRERPAQLVFQFRRRELHEVRMRPRVRGQGVDRGLRDHALRALAGKDGQVREWAAAHRLRLAPVPEWALVASEQELHAATRHPGITLASHTWTHPNLVQLPPAELEDELRRPLAWLRQRFERVISWLRSPYGLASRAVEAAAAAAGYTAALVLEGGWCAPGRVRRYAVPRHGVPRDLSVNGFVLCTSGLCRHDA